MYTVYMKGNSAIYKSGFDSWEDADTWARTMFCPGDYEIEREW